MFAFLSERINLTGDIKLHSLAWNPYEGWLLCGGSSGLLKVLKLESDSSSVLPPTTAKDPMMLPESTLTMDQTLEGHSGAVKCLAWNLNFVKFATSDENGLIIVWTLHSGVWHEEMMNNKNQSVVKDMKWTPDGSRICIIYADGSVIVGSVEGNRLWANQLEFLLKFAEWSPDGKLLLFVCASNKIHVHDKNGNKMKTLGRAHFSMSTSKNGTDQSDNDPIEIVGIHWCDKKEGCFDPDAPSLAISFAHGICQLYKGIDDTSPIILDTNLVISQCKWCPNGSIIALSGIQINQGQDDKSKSIHCFVKFYDSFGNQVRCLSLPVQHDAENRISAVTWEGNGLRVGIAIGASIYIADVRPNHKWSSFGTTIVYAFIETQLQTHKSPQTGVMFWNYSNDEKHVRYFLNVRHIEASSQNCLIVVNERVSKRSKDKQSFTFLICDSVGFPLVTRKTHVEPIIVAVSSSYCVSSDGTMIEIWTYNSSQSNDKNLKESMHLKSLRLENVCSAYVSDTCIYFGLESGVIKKYLLPNVIVANSFKINFVPKYIDLNCDQTKMSIIDNMNSLFILDLKEDANDSMNDSKSILLSSPNNNVWDIKWSKDDGTSFAVMKNSELIVYETLNRQCEESTSSKGYLLKYDDMEIVAVMLDNVMSSPKSPEKSRIKNFESKSPKELRKIISNKGLIEALRFLNNITDVNIIKNIGKLWKLFAKYALEELNLQMAEIAFVKCEDYRGIDFVKKLKMYEDEMRQKAEVLRFYGKFDEAEVMYREMDRMDLAIELRMYQGEWFRAVQLIQSGEEDPETLQQAWYHIGEYYKERYNWSKAATYYLQAKSWENAVDCCIRADDFALLKKVSENICNESDILPTLGKKFEAFGLHKEAVLCYTKVDDINSAITTCIRTNQWEDAIALAKQHNFSKIFDIISEEANLLVEKNKKLQAAELYCKANLSIDAAQILTDIAGEIIKENADYLLAKKIHVLAALEVERYRKNSLKLSNYSIEGKSAVKNTLTNLELLMSSEDHHKGGIKQTKILDNAWRNASACHYFLLSHRQLYTGKTDAAMKTAIRCVEFEDILGTENVFGLVGLTSFRNKYFGICSRAFFKLETISSRLQTASDEIETLAFDIFTQNSPEDPHPISQCYISCLESRTTYSACTISGRSIINERVIQCRCCHHYMIEVEAQHEKYCPLCHVEIEINNAIVIIMEEHEE